jgi:AcrR family transcriptional regulator
VTANEPFDGRTLRGNQTRERILRRAVEIASMEGLGALSLGRIATDLGISKSGVFNLFGSMEELQLATIKAAQQKYAQTVVVPAMAEPPGVARLTVLCEAYLDYSAGRVFPGGCFFFAVQPDFDSQPGRIRDLLASLSMRWVKLMTTCCEEAKNTGELAADTDAGQLAFELIAYLEMANGQALLHDDTAVYGRARTAVATRLRAAAS